MSEEQSNEVESDLAQVPSSLDAANEVTVKRVLQTEKESRESPRIIEHPTSQSRGIQADPKRTGVFSPNR
jgi:hypothetical protein